MKSTLIFVLAIAASLGIYSLGCQSGLSTQPTIKDELSAPVPSNYAILAWNDLGMHCFDGKDYSVFSILPPYNNLHAQVIDRRTGKRATTGFTLTYEALADPSGSINTGSSTKTNFWSYVDVLYGHQPLADHGLNLNNPNVSNPTPNRTPAALGYNSTWRWFEAEGVPITPYDDSGNKNFYPLVRLVARDSTGQLAETQTVLPVSDELSCKTCHATSTVAAAMPPVRGWAHNPNPERDWKLNILRIHDDKNQSDATYTAALRQLGIEPSTGLSGQADFAGRPVLCASCHGSNALKQPSMQANGVQLSTLTSAIHKRHASAINPTTGTTLDSATDRTACYMCHPGSETKCLRGAMSEVPNLSCQSCHGNLSAVGAPLRQGWLQEPNCHSCHHDGLRETTALTAAGKVRIVSDKRFATLANVPASGYSLYRFSSGHGGMQCEACHGSTHAEYSSKEGPWTSSHDNDSLEPRVLQGHAGAIQECSVCHAKVPLTSNRGPHGMHTIGQSWVYAHGDRVESSGISSCQYCHDARTSTGKFTSQWRGSSLSTVKTARTFSVGRRSVTLQPGTQVGCYHCHNGPFED